jgi:hypothetical protein
MADANEFAINEAGTSKKLTGTLMKAWAGNVLRNASTAAQAPAGGSSVYLTNSNITIPTGKLRVGTVFRYTLAYSKTAAGTAARSHVFRLGTNGSTADAAILTFTSGATGATVDQGYHTIQITIRGPLSASCIAHGVSFLTHATTGTTGLITANETEVLHVTSSTFDATAASLIAGLSVTVGASEVLTYEQVFAEAYNL